MSWSSTNPIVSGVYYGRFSRSLSAMILSGRLLMRLYHERGISGADADEIRVQRAEARFLRAYQYSVLMDLFASLRL
jgi:hypothetical protein